MIDFDFSSGEKIKVPNDLLLKEFFALRSADDEFLYLQTSVESFFADIDMSDLVKNNVKFTPLCLGDDSRDYKLNMALGANCEKGDVDYHSASRLFMRANVYTAENLRRVGALDKLDGIPDINLAGNDFSGEVWDFRKFLVTVLKNIEGYVQGKYNHRFAEINDVEDLDFPETYVDESSVNAIWKAIEDDTISLVSKLIPNLRETGLKIQFVPDCKDFVPVVAYPIIDEALASGKFDGCYLDFSFKLTCESNVDPLHYRGLHFYNDWCKISSDNKYYFGTDEKDSSQTGVQMSKRKRG